MVLVGVWEEEEGVVLERNFWNFALLKMWVDYQGITKHNKKREEGG